jgi:CheY-like chemotaxis protein
MADDDVDTLEVLADLVAHEGAAVRTAGSAQKALEVLRTLKPDLLLRTSRCPTWTAASSSRSSVASQLFGVAVTGFDDASDRKRCLEAGFAGLVTKPFEVETLLDLIATLVPHPHAAERVAISRRRRLSCNPPNVDKDAAMARKSRKRK